MGIVEQVVLSQLDQDEKPPMKEYFVQLIEYISETCTGAASIADVSRYMKFLSYCASETKERKVRALAAANLKKVKQKSPLDDKRRDVKVEANTTLTETQTRTFFCDKKVTNEAKIVAPSELDLASTTVPLGSSTYSKVESIANRLDANLVPSNGISPPGITSVAAASVKTVGEDGTRQAKQPSGEESSSMNQYELYNLCSAPFYTHYSQKKVSESLIAALLGMTSSMIGWCPKKRVLTWRVSVKGKLPPFLLNIGAQICEAGVHLSSVKAHFVWSSWPMAAGGEVFSSGRYIVYQVDRYRIDSSHESHPPLSEIHDDLLREAVLSGGKDYKKSICPDGSFLGPLLNDSGPVCFAEPICTSNDRSSKTPLARGCPIWRRAGRSQQALLNFIEGQVEIIRKEFMDHLRSCEIGLEGERQLTPPMVESFTFTTRRRVHLFLSLLVDTEGLRGVEVLDVLRFYVINYSLEHVWLNELYHKVFGAIFNCLLDLMLDINKVFMARRHASSAEVRILLNDVLPQFNQRGLELLNKHWENIWEGEFECLLQREEQSIERCASSHKISSQALSPNCFRAIEQVVEIAKVHTRMETEMDTGVLFEKEVLSDIDFLTWGEMVRSFQDFNKFNQLRKNNEVLDVCTLLDRYFCNTLITWKRFMEPALSSSIIMKTEIKFVLTQIWKRFLCLHQYDVQVLLKEAMKAGCDGSIFLLHPSFLNVDDSEKMKITMKFDAGRLLMEWYEDLYSEVDTALNDGVKSYKCRLRPFLETHSIQPDTKAYEIVNWSFSAGEESILGRIFSETIINCLQDCFTITFLIHIAIFELDHCSVLERRRSSVFRAEFKDNTDILTKDKKLMRLHSDARCFVRALQSTLHQEHLIPFLNKVSAISDTFSELVKLVDSAVGILRSSLKKLESKYMDLLNLVFQILDLNREILSTEFDEDTTSKIDNLRQEWDVHSLKFLKRVEYDGSGCKSRFDMNLYYRVTAINLKSAS